MKPYAAMMMIRLFRESVKASASGDSAMRPPSQTANSSPTMPMMLASSDLSFAEAIHVQAHEQREWDRETNRERSPWRFGKRVDDNQAKSGECNHDDEKDRNARDEPESGLISVRAISASDLPLRRTLPAMIMKSCTAPPRQTPITSHNSPGK